MKKSIISIFIVVIGVFLFVGVAIAYNGQLIEHFNGRGVGGRWEVLAGDNNIFYEAGKLNMSVTGTDYFPYIMNKLPVFPESQEFELEVRFAYPTHDIHGNGITASYFSEVTGLYHDWFVIWHDSNHDIQLKLWNVTSGVPWDSEYHTAKFVWSVKEDKTQVYLDGVLLNERGMPTLTDPPEFIEIGHPNRYDSAWTSLSIDYIKVNHHK